jgi:hypothetical protein
MLHLFPKTKKKKKKKRLKENLLKVYGLDFERTTFGGHGFWR